MDQGDFCVCGLCQRSETLPAAKFSHGSGQKTCYVSQACAHGAGRGFQAIRRIIAFHLVVLLFIAILGESEAKWRCFDWLKESPVNRSEYIPNKKAEIRYKTTIDKET